MKSYIVGNWKMNFTVGESSVYLHKLLQKVRAYRDVEVIVAPSAIALQPLSLQIDRKKMRLAAQVANAHDFGPYTGEISMAQLRGVVDYCLVGQAERRKLFCESDRKIRDAVAAAVRCNIRPILCIGETGAERDYGETYDVLRDQLLGGLSSVSVEDLGKVIVAYEPIWAISSTTEARAAEPENVAMNVKFLRELLAETYTKKIAEEMPILFGGGVRELSAEAYLRVPGVNGLLIGQRSIIADEFIEIVETARKVRG